jgi:hypothetical protein
MNKTTMFSNKNSQNNRGNRATSKSKKKANTPEHRKIQKL